MSAGSKRLNCEPAFASNLAAFGEPSFKSGVTRNLKMPALAILCLCFLVATASYAPASEEGSKGRGYVEIGGGFATGDFGTGTRSSLSYLGPMLGYVSRRWDIAVSAPYLFLTNGTAAQINGVNRVSGIGDMILRGDGIFVPEGHSGFSLDGGIALKFPTANETNGLGTGKPDFGAFAGIHQRAGRVRISLFGGYIKVGSPSGAAYKDTPMVGGAISGNLGRTNLSVSFESRRSLIAGEPNPHEVGVDLFRAMSRKLAIKGRSFFGLNKGGPDFGLSAGIVCWF